MASAVPTSRQRLEPFKEVEAILSRTGKGGKSQCGQLAQINRRTCDSDGTIVLEGKHGSCWENDHWQEAGLLEPSETFQLSLHLLKPCELITHTRVDGLRETHIQMSRQGTLPSGKTVYMGTPYRNALTYGWEEKDLYVFTESEDPKKKGTYEISNEPSYLLM